MKRFLSMLLVAMLLVGALSTAAFAATTEDRTAEYTFKVSGNCATYQFQIVADAPVKITDITGSAGLMINKANGKVAYLGDGQNNIDVDATVTVTVVLPAGSECGDYKVSATGRNAYKVVFNEDGSAAPLEKAEITVKGGGTPFEHNFTDWKETTPAEDCLHKGVETGTCSYCGVTTTRDGSAGPHDLSDEWKFNDDDHWHVCKHHEDHKEDVAAHTLKWTVVKDPTYTEPGLKKGECTVCAYETEDDIPKLTPPGDDDDDDDDVVDMGDITPYGLYNSMIAVVVVAMLSVVALVFKRKTSN